MTLQQVNLGTIPNNGADGDVPRTAFTRINDNFKLLDDSGVSGPVSAAREVSSYNDTTQPGRWIGTATATNRPPGFGRTNFEVSLGHDGSVTQSSVEVASGQLATRGYDPGTSTWSAWVPGGFSGALPVGRGGTGGTTPAAARTGLGLKSAAVADILGTVSHLNGVPTGAIIERGSNANGNFTKLADGTMFCWGKKLSPSIAANSTVDLVVSMPAAFVDLTFVVNASSQPSSSWDISPVKSARAVGASDAYITVSNGASAQTITIFWSAVGWWR